MLGYLLMTIIRIALLPYACACGLSWNMKYFIIVEYDIVRPTTFLELKEMES